MSNKIELDIIIPVYNEGENIVETLRAIQKEVKTPLRVLIGYDFDEDNSLSAIEKIRSELSFEVINIKNRSRGPHDAVMTCFNAALSNAILVFPADEVYNIGIIDSMYSKFCEGNEIVVASRFMKGGHMEGGPFVKSLVVRLASFLLRYLVGIPATDATYGLRLFSKKVIDSIVIESNAGFTYAIELLVKCHRLKWPVGEVPAHWYTREKGESRFNFKKWLPRYARWFFYALATTYLRRSPESVILKTDTKPIS